MKMAAQLHLNTAWRQNFASKFSHWQNRLTHPQIGVRLGEHFKIRFLETVKIRTQWATLCCRRAMFIPPNQHQTYGWIVGCTTASRIRLGGTKGMVKFGQVKRLLARCSSDQSVIYVSHNVLFLEKTLGRICSAQDGLDEMKLVKAKEGRKQSCLGNWDWINGNECQMTRGHF